MENVGLCVREEAVRLRQAVADHCFDEMNKSSRTISDLIHRLAGHCNINLVNDSLRNWQGALKEGGVTELNAVSMLLQFYYLIKSRRMSPTGYPVSQTGGTCALSGSTC